MNSLLMPVLGRVLRFSSCALLCLGLSGVAQADDATDPTSRVARISYLLGNIQVQTTDDSSWSAAGLNQPLTSGDALLTEARARAELQMGGANLQVDENTQLQLSELSDNGLRLEVVQGKVNLRVRTRGETDRIEINTPQGVLAVNETGNYSVAVTAGNATLIQVRTGSAEVSADRQRFAVHANEQLRLSGDGHLAAQFDSVGSLDEFDRWATERNQRAEQDPATRYVSADVIGYEDLDDYGDWQYYADYGYVWRPTRVSSGWAPYRYGRWRWVGPWGWTWIDDAPWGFAPFHYGRWANVHDRWCWVPGPRGVRPVYAPALVAFLGTPGVRGSVNVGWVPLGPREIYRPVYRSSPGYVINVNLSNTRLTRGEFDRDLQRPHQQTYRNQAINSVVTRERNWEGRQENSQGRGIEADRTRVNEPRLWRREPLQPSQPAQPRSMNALPDAGVTHQPPDSGERNLRRNWRGPSPEAPPQPETSAPRMRNEERRSIHEASPQGPARMEPQPSQRARENNQSGAPMQSPNRDIGRDRGRIDGDRR